MSFTIEGEYNTATVHTNLSRDECEDAAFDQIKEIVNAPAFEGDNDVQIMPDFHYGAGAVIGFTMPVKDKVVPNTIGLDIGCGMEAASFGQLQIEDLQALDEAIRDRVPTGFDVHGRSDYHMIDDFPWERCQEKLESFTESTNFEIGYTDEIYRGDYFENVCMKVGADMGRAINSMGTLGGGNHFIELGRDEEENLWCIIHSGSRGIGAQIAQYWQDQATNYTTRRKTIDDVPESVREYMNENWKPRAEKIRDEFDGKEIQNKFDKVSQAIQEYGPSSDDRNTDLDYLEGEEAHGYIIDMIFAQTYAIESRKKMMRAVAAAIGEVTSDYSFRDFVDYESTVTSVHNYINFEDATIRKGACSAKDGERLVVPFNMKYGTIIARGKGKDSWNQSSAHGAGRAMSRTEAESRFDGSDFSDQTDGVYMSEQPLDEIPGAYKDPEQIEDALGENIEIEKRIEPFMSIKAE